MKFTFLGQIAIIAFAILFVLKLTFFPSLTWVAITSPIWLPLSVSVIIYLIGTIIYLFGSFCLWLHDKVVERKNKKAVCKALEEEAGEIRAELTRLKNERAETSNWFNESDTLRELKRSKIIKLEDALINIEKQYKELR